MKNFKVLVLLCLLGLGIGIIGCKKDEPKPVDNTFYFTCKVNGVAWNSQNLTDPLIADFVEIDTMPSAAIRHDSLLIGACAQIGSDTSSIIMAATLSNPANAVGTYLFSDNISTISVGKAIGLYAAQKLDYFGYIFAADQFTYAPGAQLKVTKHANKKIDGEFNFKIIRKSDQAIVYDITDGKFQNLPIR